ncbi:unnamed protein product [Tuber melanosporum]|uniref:(Perigord truffle) hypothetical protein n=1 Tax=Tuber melanosporum (strain Mel28) TaxID=656061 RepID=D5G6F1_TUBMM|nr:uncharacterized protein GSTUM_00004454001 [Tuber melanosporum]CAZ80094.1 unnamed protein product [Tuber melanosporum]
MPRLTGEGGGRNPTGIPPAKTESALQARKTFYCDLCSKGYSRSNEYEAHENSYDHQHKKRFQEMKAMQRDPASVERRRERERRRMDEGIAVIKPIKIEEKRAVGGGFKKGGFRNAFGRGEEGGGAKMEVGGGGAAGAGGVGGVVGVEESDTEDEGWERYDPARPTD